MASSKFTTKVHNTGHCIATTLTSMSEHSDDVESRTDGNYAGIWVQAERQGDCDVFTAIASGGTGAKFPRVEIAKVMDLNGKRTIQVKTPQGWINWE